MFSSFSRTTQKRGFSLIEAAIVLGVVGLIIGGIWAAAASFWENKLMEDSATEILNIGTKLQALISRSDIASIGAINITSTARDSGIFPASWINSAGNIRNPFSQWTYISLIVQDGFYVGSPPLFQLEMAGIPYATCQQLLRKLIPRRNINLLAGLWSGTGGAIFLPNTVNNTFDAIAISQARCADNQLLRFYFSPSM